MISFKSKGDFSKSEKYLNKLSAWTKSFDADKYGKMGVEALSAATPVRTGLTAASWSYKIERGNDSLKIIFENSNVSKEWAHIAILIQHGHATRNGAWVEGIDYINPALSPIFTEIKEEAWREVCSL